MHKRGLYKSAKTVSPSYCVKTSCQSNLTTGRIATHMDDSVVFTSCAS